ncbi:hypothetical protein IWQ60_008625 [Tieghemiomyces parasiticus]|uniref:Anaphase-promoting complex subunit 4 WD40 domain-containing protein n=1 Tax=Tieghemiomyces parasiticus TaxID=78921 RepID=A0A9W7ZWX9_9FUNG|nr:hypothetical protein IWQ60_008625 [Tieghemiomyces parasiticus]
MASSHVAEPVEFPGRSAVTVAEIDGSLISLTSEHDSKALLYIRSGAPAYPHLMVPSQLKLARADTAGTHGSTFSTTSFSIFPPASRKRTANWIDYASEQLVHWIQVRDHLRDQVERWQTQWVAPYLPWLRPVTAPRPHAVAATQVQATGPARLLDWHPYRHLFAVSHVQDVVFLYDMEREGWLSNCLVHPFQTDITCLAWHPRAGRTLAVGAREGVCLWRINLDQTVSRTARDPDPRAAAPPVLNLDGSRGRLSETHASDGTARGAIHTGHAWLEFLRFPGFDHVSSLAWDPTGRYLAVGSATSGAILIWDVATATATPLRRVPSPTVRLAWSPNGQHLCSTHTNRQLRVWDVSEWRSATWSDFPDHVAHIAWAPDSRCVYFALHASAAVYHLVLRRSAPALEGQFALIAQLTPQRVSATAGEAGLGGGGGDSSRDAISDSPEYEVGGCVGHLALDPSGNRLVIGFTPADRATEFEYQQDNRFRRRPVVKSAEVLAVLTVRDRRIAWVNSSTAAEPNAPACGFIRGPAAGTLPSSTKVGTNASPPPLPTCVTFAKQFDRGALLTVDILVEAKTEFGSTTLN